MRAAAWSTLLVFSCAPGLNEGQERPLIQHWQVGSLLPSTDRSPHAGPPIRCQGREVVLQGEWVKDGPFTFFDEQGKEAARGSYVAGLEEGFWTQVEPSGVLARGNFLAGRRDGPWSYTHPNGSPQEQGAYSKGKRIGRWTRWYADGTLAAEVGYQAGKRQGTCTYYTEEGGLDPHRTGHYEGGALSSPER